MATRRYMQNQQDNTYGIIEAVGAATVSRRIELTVDWDALATDGLTGQTARLLVIQALEQFQEYIEQSGKYNVKA